MSDRLLDAVLRNLNWFRSSGVMDPADGRWGVGERVVVMEGNAVADKITEAFYAWTPRDGYCVIEQRRADCNFQAAWLFLRAFEVTGSPEDRATGENLLYYLYQRSGLLMQYEPGTPHGLWQWSHIRSTPIPYFDDNAWCLAIQIAIGKRYPELDKKYKMLERAKVLAGKDVFCHAPVLRICAGRGKPERFVERSRKCLVRQYVLSPLVFTGDHGHVCGV